DSSDVSILLGDGKGGFSPARLFGGLYFPSFVDVADFNEDGVLDLAVPDLGPFGKEDGTTVSILLGDGTGGFLPPRDTTVPTGPYAIAIGDLNEDGHRDLVVSHPARGSITLWSGDGTGAFAALSAIGHMRYPLSVVLADLDGDGHLDVAVGHDTYLTSEGI